MSYENEASRYDENFGNCPKCNRTHGCRSVGREHWYVCHTHKMKWCIGWNVFTVEQTTGEFVENLLLLGTYTEVRPVMQRVGEAGRPS